VPLAHLRANLQQQRQCNSRSSKSRSRSKGKQQMQQQAANGSMRMVAQLLVMLLLAQQASDSVLAVRLW
jgi:hypothetical protein